MIDVPRASRVLTESRLGNLFFHFGFWGCVVLSRAEEEREGASIGSLISVLTSSMSNTANLLTSSNWGTLFTSRTKQNPPLGLSKSPLPLLHPCKGILLEVCLVMWVGSYLRAVILLIAFSLSPSFPFCVITCDASSSNIELCVIISQVPCELCLDGLVI